MSDFTGFWLGGVHSSTYGLLRVSNGDRYSEGLIPELENQTLEPIGRDGSLYVNSTFKQTSFVIPVAFDSVTEQQLRDMRTWLGKKELQSLRFDERPYKTYWVKIAERPILDYICFLENQGSNNERRVYKGEGELFFTAYEPWGYCNANTSYVMKGASYANDYEQLHAIQGINYQYLESYLQDFDTPSNNITEWADASGLLSKKTWKRKKINTFVFDPPNGEENIERYYANLYNPGDTDADCKIYLVIGLKGDNYGILGQDGQYPPNQLPITIAVHQIINITIFDEWDSRPEKGAEYVRPYSFLIDTYGLTTLDTIEIDTKTHVVKLYRWVWSGTYWLLEESLRYDLVSFKNDWEYSNYFEQGDFPTIPKGKTTMQIYYNLNSSNNGTVPLTNIRITPFITYNYKYY